MSAWWCFWWLLLPSQWWLLRTVWEPASSEGHRTVVSAVWLHQVTLAWEVPSGQIHVFPGDVVAEVAGLPSHQGCTQLSRSSFQAETRSVSLLLCLFGKGRREEIKKNPTSTHRALWNDKLSRCRVLSFLTCVVKLETHSKMRSYIWNPSANILITQSHHIKNYKLVLACSGLLCTLKVFLVQPYQQNLTGDRAYTLKSILLPHLI